MIKNTIKMLPQPVQGEMLKRAEVEGRIQRVNQMILSLKLALKNDKKVVEYQAKRVTRVNGLLRRNKEQTRKFITKLVLDAMKQK